ncbi:MAG: metal ABC transporter substrate-binding protein [Acidobacteriota bacterium]
MKTKGQLLALVLVASGGMSSVADATVKVVTTLPDYAAIARDIGGDRVEVQAIVAGNADAHFIKPKPSYALMLRDADLFVSTGLDLELWAPVLVNKSGNKKIVDGAPGYVAAAHGINLLQKPASLDRSGGDIHVYGNPHIQTSPLNAIVIARNIATGLCKVDPEGCPAYEEGVAAFTDRVERRLYGDGLLEVIDADILNQLTASGRLVPFLEEHGQLIERIQAEHIEVLLAANYFERRKPEMIAERTGIVPVVVPTSVGGEPGVDTYFDLMDTILARLLDGFRLADEEVTGTPVHNDPAGSHNGHAAEHHEP